jgi:hypothetical protein
MTLVGHATAMYGLMYRGAVNMRCFHTSAETVDLGDGDRTTRSAADHRGSSYPPVQRLRPT